MKYRNHSRNKGLQLLNGRYSYLKKIRKYADRGQVKVLPSGFSEDQTWGGLIKAWVGYVISDKHQDEERKTYYAAVIQKLQSELGIKMSAFPELQMMALGFFEDNAEFMADEMDEQDVMQMFLDSDSEFAKKLRREEG